MSYKNQARKQGDCYRSRAETRYTVFPGLEKRGSERKQDQPENHDGIGHVNGQIENVVARYVDAANPVIERKGEVTDNSGVERVGE